MTSVNDYRLSPNVDGKVPQKVSSIQDAHVFIIARVNHDCASVKPQAVCFFSGVSHLCSPSRLYVHSAVGNWKKCLHSIKLKDSVLSLV